MTPGAGGGAGEDKRGSCSGETVGGWGGETQVNRPLSSQISGVINYDTCFNLLVCFRLI